MQFRYASCVDVLLMILGFFAAVANGSTLPLLMLYFGNILDIFISQEVSFQIAANLTNLTGISNIDCSTTFDNFTSLSPGGSGAGTIGTSTAGTTSTGIITETLQSIPDSRFSNLECLLGDAFIGEINIIVFIFVGLAVGVLLCSFIEVSTFQFAAERQTYRIRLRYYRAIMRQNIAWFDENPTGGLVNRLSE